MELLVRNWNIERPTLAVHPFAAHYKVFIKADILGDVTELENILQTNIALDIMNPKSTTSFSPGEVALLFDTIQEIKKLVDTTGICVNNDDKKSLFTLLLSELIEIKNGIKATINSDREQG